MAEKNIYDIVLKKRFFVPDQKMIDWLVKYADGRLIIDIGCGGGQLLDDLYDKGKYGKTVGIEPNFRYMSDPFVSVRLRSDGTLKQILPYYVEDEICVSLLNKIGSGALILFCRPSHELPFVANALSLKHKDTEALYITVPRNLEIYNDLGEHKERAVKLEHEGRGREFEVVYSIK